MTAVDPGRWTALGKALWSARVAGTALPVGDSDRPASEDEAYAIQREVHRAGGETAIGWKLGATTAPALALLGLDQPFVGPVYAGHHHESGATVALHPAHGPMLETELTVRLGADLVSREADYTREEVAEAIADVVPSFEIIGCRVSGGIKTARLLVLSDGGANDSMVEGSSRCDWRTLDLATHPIRLSVNGEHRAEGSGSALVWGHPLDAVAWLATHPFVAPRGLRAGDVVMTGTLTGMTPIASGDEAVGDFGALGEVRARFG